MKHSHRAAAGALVGVLLLLYGSGAIVVSRFTDIDTNLVWWAQVLAVQVLAVEGDWCQAGLRILRKPKGLRLAVLAVLAGLAVDLRILRKLAALAAVLAAPPQGHL